MASEWPDGWITALLKDADIPVTAFAIKVTSAWMMSTPMLAYTNNPLGMPAIKGVTAELMRTGYAIFATMPLMRAQFAQFIKSQAGHALHESLAVSESFAAAYRAIHALPWPANKTETDWPSAVLDLTTESTRNRLATTRDAADRKTSGAYGSDVAFGRQDGISARRTAEYVNRLNKVNDAINQGPR